jgi:hypothetical protein
VLLVHPHAPETQMGPGLQVAVQSAQTPPLVPHAKLAVPSAHVPVVAPMGTSQQPPLHVWVALHVLVQACVAVSQASPGWQSADVVQPHVPLAVHAVPVTEVVQFVHAPPLVPQSVLVFPATHVVPLQHPPLQVAAPEHDVLQVWVVKLHASPVGQSADDWQPHDRVPGRHT